jgi:hypothetical protein
MRLRTEIRALDNGTVSCEVWSGGREVDGLLEGGVLESVKIGGSSYLMDGDLPWRPLHFHHYRLGVA